ncbi:MAG: TonB-dependent receptor, partial [Acidobacteria bacterium]|nr:TonB-dependent receptor [Acidobacteriota bacterium]
MPACLRLPIIVASCVLALVTSAFAQQRGSVTGRVMDPDGLSLPGATITVTEQNTGFSRTVVTAENGAYSVPNLDPGVYTVTVEMPSFAGMKQTDVKLGAGTTVNLELKLQVAGLKEEVVVTGQAPLIETTSNQIGGSLTSREIEDVPSNFRNFTALTQLIPGMTPNPAASTFEGGQVVANGTPSQSNVYLIDGMYNNDDRLGGSQGTQVRVVLDNIEEYQVLSNQYSTEYGGGAGAIINMVTRGGTNNFSGRAYTYFRDDRFNSRGHFLPDTAEKPQERTLQTGAALGGPIVRDRAHFYFTVEQLNTNNFVSVRWVLETAPTKGEGFNTNNQTPDAQVWESDWDHLVSGTYTTILNDRASNVVRVGRIGEELATTPQGFFDADVNFIGFAGRDPFSIGQSNVHPGYVTGRGGEGVNTRIRTYVFDESFSYFVPSLFGGEHTFKAGGGISFNNLAPRKTVSSGIYNFRTDLPYDPNNAATYPFQFDVTVGIPDDVGYGVTSKDRRHYFFAEDKWTVSNNLTLNLGLRYDHQRQTPASSDDFAPRVGFAWDVTGEGTTVVRGGFGRFFAYPPVVLDLTHQQNGVLTLFPVISINAANDTCGCILRPDMITDSAGNRGVAVLSPAGQAELNRLRDAVIAGSSFNQNPRIDSADRQLPFQWAWSVGVNHQVFANAAVAVDYVANASRDQMGVIDLNEPVNGVRPGVAVFDPGGTLIPAAARSTPFARVLQTVTSPVFNGDYKSLQFSFNRRMAKRWSGRMAYTLQESHYVGIGNPDARRVWLDNDPRADYGRFVSDRRHVLAGSASVNPWSSFSINGVV